MKLRTAFPRCLTLAFACLTAAASAQEARVPLTPTMIQSSSELADFSGLADEQSLVGNPPSGVPKHGWEVPSQHWKQFPFSATIDLGQARDLSALWVFDTNGEGEFALAVGSPGQWQTVTNFVCRQYLQWARLSLEVTTRYLRIELKSPAANFAELALYDFTRKRSAPRPTAPPRCSAPVPKPRPGPRWICRRLAACGWWTKWTALLPSRGTSSASNPPASAAWKACWAVLAACCAPPKARRPTWLFAWAAGSCSSPARPTC
jgi:hypothetical protein